MRWGGRWKWGEAEWCKCIREENEATEWCKYEKNHPKDAPLCDFPMDKEDVVRMGLERRCCAMRWTYEDCSHHYHVAPTLSKWKLLPSLIPIVSHSCIITSFTFREWAKKKKRLLPHEMCLDLWLRKRSAHFSCHYATYKYKTAHKIRLDLWLRKRLSHFCCDYATLHWAETTSETKPKE